MNKKTLGIILGIAGNAILLIGLLLVILSFRYDTQKEYTYTETTNVTIDKKDNDKTIASERPLDDSQEHNNRVNKVQVKKEVITNDSDYQVETSKKDYQKVINKVLDSNKNDVDNSNNNSENDTKIICGMCCVNEADPGDIYCHQCRIGIDDRAKLGE